MERKTLLAWNKKENDINGIWNVKIHRGNLRGKKIKHWDRPNAFYLHF